MAGWRKGKFTLAMMFFEVIFLILFALFVEYDYGADAFFDLGNVRNPTAYLAKRNRTLHHNEEDIHLVDYYAMFQDIHVMMFIGFGFLMTFLKRYGFSSVSLNLLLASFVIQWSMLIMGFFHLHNGHIQINIVSMLQSDFAAATVLITFGSMLGKLSPLQFAIMAFCEIPIFVGNEHLGLKYFQAVDIGGSMFVHVFGAFFGLALSRVVYTREIEEQAHKEEATYDQDLFSMIGTIFLWMFWPSFNAALAPGDDKMRAVLNTYLSLAACTVTAVALSACVSKEDKFNMEHLQNCTLAGGVAVGTSADMMIHPWGAMLIGVVAGTISVLGFRFIPPMEARMRLHDTCGVINLHGLPGVLSGIAGAVTSALATEAVYGPSLYQIFPALVPKANTPEFALLSSELKVKPGLGRTPGLQAAYQMVGLAHTLIIAVAGGIVTGFILKIPIWNRPEHSQMFEDEPWFEIPYGYPPEYNIDERTPLNVVTKRKEPDDVSVGYDNAGNDVEFTKV